MYNRNHTFCHFLWKHGRQQLLDAVCKGPDFEKDFFISRYLFHRPAAAGLLAKSIWLFRLVDCSSSISATAGGRVLTFLPQSQFRWTWKPIFLKETIIFDPFYLLLGCCHDSCKQKRVKAAVWILLLVVKETQWVWSSWGEFVFYLRFEDQFFWLYFLLNAWFFSTSNWVSEVASAYCFSCSFMFHLCSCQCLSEKVVSVWLAGGCEDHHTRAQTHGSNKGHQFLKATWHRAQEKVHVGRVKQLVL